MGCRWPDLSSARDGVDYSQKEKIGQKTGTAIGQEWKGHSDHRHETQGRPGIEQKMEQKDHGRAQAEELLEILSGERADLEDPEDQVDESRYDRESHKHAPFLDQRRQHEGRSPGAAAHTQPPPP